MTGPEHYKEAEKSLKAMSGKDPRTVTVLLAEAQVHATLALAAAAVTAPADVDRWYEVTLP